MFNIPNELQKIITIDENEKVITLCNYDIESIIKVINWTIGDYFKFHNKKIDDIIKIKMRAINMNEFYLIKIDQNKIPNRSKKLLQAFINGMSAEEYDFYSSLFVDNGLRPIIFNIRDSLL